jgi:hypothetical protein
LASLLAGLSEAASARGLSDSAWARQAGLPKESLSRLRRRSDCDFSTLARLADAVGCRWSLVPAASAAVDGHLPVDCPHDLEQSLLALCAAGDTTRAHWQALGPPFFMAGLAMLLAGSDASPRQPWLALAEQLHPGISEPGAFQRWLDRSPLEPRRFLTLLELARASLR